MPKSTPTGNPITVIDSPGAPPPAQGGLTRALHGGELVERLTTELVNKPTPRRLGVWIESGFDVYYAKFPYLVLMAAVGLGLDKATPLL